MSSDTAKWTSFLEREWSKPQGFLGRAREGQFDPEDGKRFVVGLKAIRLPAESKVMDRHLVSLLWYIPLFLSWQRDRIIENGGDAASFEKVSNEVQTLVEEILGVP